MIGTVNPQSKAHALTQPPTYYVDIGLGTWYNTRMARSRRNEVAIKQFAVAISRITKNHPDVTPKDIERWGWTRYDLTVAEESIRKALRGQIDPTQCAVELLLLIAGYFEVEPSGLGSIAEGRLRSVLAFAGDSTGPSDDDTPRIIGKHSSACTRSPLFQVPDLAAA